MTRTTPADAEHVETDMHHTVARRIADITLENMIGQKDHALAQALCLITADVYRLLCDDLIRRGVERRVAAGNMSYNLLRIVKGTLQQLSEKDGVYPHINIPARR